jgi:hypothetical protein
MVRARFGFLTTISMFAVTAAGACGGDDESADGAAGTAGAGGSSAGAAGAAGSSGECAEGCTCEMDTVCEYVCAANCTVECLGATCTVECPEGGCTLDADFGANANYSCDGGNCETDCDNESICGVDCAGGGCKVLCDADSTCTVACSETGAPCEVTCASGGRAQCTGNCTLTGCDGTCIPDPSYQPSIVPSDFTNVVDNPLFPLPVGAVWVYEAPDEVITVTVTSDAKTVMGIDVVVVHDEVKTSGGELIEDTRDWYAQHSDGSVWYFGEDTAEYSGGQVVTTKGSWEAGKDGAQPGVIMKAAPAVGDVYRQEYYACEAEDMGEVLESGASVTVPAGSYTGCVRIRDFSPLDPTANEIKTFCPGVGVAAVEDVVSGKIVESLKTVTMP